MSRRLLEFSGGSVTFYSRAAKFRDVAPNNLASLLIAILAWLLRWKLIAEQIDVLLDMPQTLVYNFRQPK